MIIPGSTDYAAVRFLIEPYLYSLLDKAADKILAGESPSFEESEQIKQLYRRLKGSRNV